MRVDDTYVGEVVFAKLSCMGWSCCKGVCVRAPRTWWDFCSPISFLTAAEVSVHLPEWKKSRQETWDVKRKAELCTERWKEIKERKKLKLPKSSMLWSFNKTLFTSAPWLIRFKRKSLKNKIFCFEDKGFLNFCMQKNFPQSPRDCNMEGLRWAWEPATLRHCSGCQTVGMMWAERTWVVFTVSRYYSEHFTFINLFDK